MPLSIRFEPSDTADERTRIAANAQALKELWDSLDESGRDELVSWLWQEAVGYQLPGEPWSAVYVVAAVNLAVPGALYRTALHTAYAREAMMKGYGRYETEKASTIKNPQVGDIVIKNRSGNSFDFETLRKSTFPSHGDIIVEVHDDFVVTIGGNKVGGAIAYESYPRNDDGSVGGDVFAIMTFLDDENV